MGHVFYLWVGFYDQASNAIFVADTDYLESEETREINRGLLSGLARGRQVCPSHWGGNRLLSLPSATVWMGWWWHSPHRAMARCMRRPCTP